MSVTEEKKPHHGFQSYGNWQREEDLYVWPCSLWAFDEDVNTHNHRNKNMYIYSYCFFIGAGSVLSSKGQKSAYSGRCLASLWAFLLLHLSVRFWKRWWKNVWTFHLLLKSSGLLPAQMLKQHLEIFRKHTTLMFQYCRSTEYQDLYDGVLLSS